MNFEFSTANKILFGQKVVHKLPDYLKSMGSVCLVIAGGHLKEDNLLIPQLESAGIEFDVVFVTSEPDAQIVEQGAKLAHEMDAEFIIAIGGGSTLDAGKAIAMLAANGGTVLDYIEVVGKGKQIKVPSLPVVAIPTTAGTGSEVTRNAVISLPEFKTKASLRSNYLLPSLAIIDPELTLHLPARETGWTGMDAITQVIEPYLSKKANPLVDAFCRPAIKRGIQTLPDCVESPDDLNAREGMAYVSLMGGMALTNAGLGAVHGFAAAIGGMYPIPHGAICACLLPVVFEANFKAMSEREKQNPAYDKYFELAGNILPIGQDNVGKLVDTIYKLKERLSIQGLNQWGVSSDNFEIIVKKAQEASSMKANPVLLTDQELYHILQDSV